MVYFFGGGFIVGDATFKSFGPEFFMQHNVVIVTLNYRIGVYGTLKYQIEYYININRSI